MPEILEIITYTVRMLDEEGKIECACKDEAEGDYEIEFLPDAAIVRCKRCGAQKAFDIGSTIQAHALLEADKLVLEPTT